MNFFGKITVEAENGGIRKTLNVFITEREDIKPFIGMDRLREFNEVIQKIEHATKKTDQSVKIKITANFEKLFTRNRTIKVPRLD